MLRPVGSPASLSAGRGQSARAVCERDDAAWGTAGGERRLEAVRGEGYIPAARFAREAAMEIPSPVMGVVKEILVAPGEAVAEGQEVMILESMKMEIDIVAPCNGVIQSVLVRPNDKVVEGQALVIVG